jgi:IS4 transposase
MNYEVTTAYETDSESGFVYDDNIKLIGQKSSSNYPHTLRRVEYIDPETGQELVFLTNHKQWTAATVAELYKERWNIEVFFKHIKTHLRIKSFVGTSENAVKIQIWTSLIAIVLLKALQQMAKYKWHLSNLINALRLHLFAKIELNQFINKPFEKSSHWEPENIQLSLFT